MTRQVFEHIRKEGSELPILLPILGRGHDEARYLRDPRWPQGLSCSCAAAFCLSAAWRKHEPVLLSHAGQVCSGRWGVQGIVGGCERRGELERPRSALLPAFHVSALIDDSGPARPVFGTLAALADDSAHLHPVFAQFFHLTAAQKAMEADLFGPFAGLWRDSLFPPCSLLSAVVPVRLPTAQAKC